MDKARSGPRFPGKLSCPGKRYNGGAVARFKPMAMRDRFIQVLGVLALAAVAATLGAAQGSKSRPVKKSAAIPPAPLAVPFPEDEKLRYQVIWGPADAATLHLAVQPAAATPQSLWHFRAKASTIKAARYLYPLDDQFDSHADVFTLSSVKYEIRIRERAKNQDRVIHMSPIGQTPPADGPSVRVPAGTRDPLSLFYGLRAADWAKTKEAAYPVYDGTKLYDVRAKETLSSGSVTVPSGTYSASRIEVRVFENRKELTNARFWVWLEESPKRLPVLIEAELPFGKLRVELTGAE